MNSVTLYAVSVLIWGSTWLCINYQLGVVEPEVSLAYRYVIAAALLFLWCALRGKSLRFDLRAHCYFLLLGLLLFGLNYLAAYRAQLYITSALNAIGFSALVWMNILNARLFFGMRSDRGVYVGALLGIAGIVTLFWPQVRNLSLTDDTLLGAGWCLCGALIASFGNMASQRAQQRQLPVLQANAWGMAYGALFLGGVAVARGAPFTFDPSPSYVISLLYLAVFGSVIAFGTYLTLLGRIGAHRAGYTVVMFPVVALILSLFFEGLVIDRYIVLGVLLVLSGNVFILRHRRRTVERAA